MLYVMKRIVFLLAVILPVICMGQDVKNVVGISTKMKTIDEVAPDTSSTIVKAPLVPEVIQGSLISCCKIAEDEEYEAIVFAPGFETFLATQQPKEFYSEATLKAKNAPMVAEWNYRYRQPLRYDPNIYEEEIIYDSNTEYGLEVEYTLYMFFKFMEKQHKMSLMTYTAHGR